MSIKKALLVVTLLVTFAVGVAMAAQYTGWIVDQKCALVGNHKGDHSSHLSADNPAVFLNESDNKVYQLKGPSRAETLLGKHVKVEGEFSGSTVMVESISELPEKSDESCVGRAFVLAAALQAAC